MFTNGLTPEQVELLRREDEELYDGGGGFRLTPHQVTVLDERKWSSPAVETKPVELTFRFDGNIVPVMKHLSLKMLDHKAYAVETVIGSETTFDTPRLDGCRPELPPPTEGITRRVYTWEWVPAQIPDALFAFSLRVTVEPPPRQPPPETHMRWSFWQADIATLTARQEQPGMSEVAIALEPAPRWYQSSDHVVGDHGLMINSDLLIKTWWTLCIHSWGAEDATSPERDDMMAGEEEDVPSRDSDRFNRWVDIWKLVERHYKDRLHPTTRKPMRNTYQELSKWLKSTHPGLGERCSPRTLAKICRAGRKGLLEHHVSVT